MYGDLSPLTLDALNRLLLRWQEFDVSSKTCNFPPWEGWNFIYIAVTVLLTEIHYDPAADLFTLVPVVDIFERQGLKSTFFFLFDPPWWTFLNGKGGSTFFFVLTLRLFRFINVLDNDPSCAGFFCLDGTSCQANRVRSESASLRWLVVSTRRTRKLCYILPHASAITRSWWGLAWKPDSLKCYWKLNKMRVAINYTHEIIECSRYSN